MNQDVELTDVLVVGFGPVGAALACLLARQGIKTTVVERNLDIFDAPRAIALDNEALRILQMCGLEDGALDLVAIPEVRMHCPQFGQYSRAVTVGMVDGHPRLVTFFQPQLEQALRRQVAGHSGVSVRLGWALESLSDQGRQVHAQVRDAAGNQREIRASFVVGADGASSLVRSLIGQDFKGKTYAEDWLIVDAKNVKQSIDHVEFICDHRRPTPHMVAPGNRQRWEFKLRRHETREQMERPEMVHSLLSPWSQGQDIEIERIAVYRFHARVADKFQQGRVFLAGDAAHITPPFVGQGLVSGLRDAANLAWKLAWVIQGHAKSDLLDSYTLERLPHAKSMINLARMMGRLVMPSNAAAAWLVHGFMKLASVTPRLKDLFENLEMKAPQQYRAGCFVRHRHGARLRGGGLFPQVWLHERATNKKALSDDVIGSGFALVAFGVDAAQSIPAHLLARWQAMGGSVTHIYPCAAQSPRPGMRIWEDMTGMFMPSKIPMGWLVLVRPDKVIYSDSPADRANQMIESAMAALHGGQSVVTAPGLHA
jgi:3-(3-hydroxy-phenyl)propionate hydroxylase